MPHRGRCRSVRGELPAVLDCHRGVPSLVRIPSERPWSCRPPDQWVDVQDRSVDTPEWGRSHAPIKSPRPFLPCPGPAHQMHATPGGVHRRYEPSRRTDEASHSESGR
jgi:hypothetical protein